MKIYTTKNGKAVYINDEQIIISDATAKVIEHFQYKVDDLNNDSAYKSLSKEALLNAAKKYTVDILTAKKNGFTVKGLFLMQNEEPISCIIFQNDIDVTSKISANTFINKYYEQLK